MISVATIVSYLSSHEHEKGRMVTKNFSMLILFFSLLPNAYNNATHRVVTRRKFTRDAIVKKRVLLCNVLQQWDIAVAAHFALAA